MGWTHALPWQAGAFTPRGPPRSWGRGVLAAAKPRSAQVVEQAVVAVDIASYGLLDLRRRPVRCRPGEQPVDDVRLGDGRPEDVGVAVAYGDTVAAHLVARVRAEPAAAPSFDGDVVGRHRAEAVLRERVAVAVAEAGEGVRRDVRAAVLRAGDGHVVAG